MESSAIFEGIEVAGRIEKEWFELNDESKLDAGSCLIECQRK